MHAAFVWFEQFFCVPHLGHSLLIDTFFIPVSFSVLWIQKLPQSVATRLNIAKDSRWIQRQRRPWTSMTAFSSSSWPTQDLPECYCRRCQQALRDSFPEAMSSSYVAWWWKNSPHPCICAGQETKYLLFSMFVYVGSHTSATSYYMGKLVTQPIPQINLIDHHIFIPGDAFPGSQSWWWERHHA